jgi:hypothetical protein
MSLSVEFLSGADADLQAAFNGFEDYREGFGAEFMIAVDAHLARMAAFPLIAPVYLRTVGGGSCSDFRTANRIRRASSSLPFWICDKLQSAFGAGFSSCPARAWTGTRVPSANA